MSSVNKDIGLSIVIPCYKEADNLPHLLQRLRQVTDDIGNVVIILVDNGSTDDTAQALIQLKVAKDPAIRVVTVPINLGYGNGLMQGVFAAETDVIAWCHADLQTDPMDVIEAFELYNRHSAGVKTIIKGQRIGRGVFDAFFTAGMSLFASLALRMQLSDINAQPKLFDRKFLALLTDYPKDFSLDLYVLVQARHHGYQILTQPVRFSERLHGEAKGGGNLKGKRKLISRTVKYILETRTKHKVKR